MAKGIFIHPGTRRGIVMEQLLPWDCRGKAMKEISTSYYFSGSISTLLKLTMNALLRD